MDPILPGDASHNGIYEDSYNKPDEAGSWYLSRKEIEENSPSKRDGIDLKKETYLRKSYCTFLQDLGMRLKVPQVTIATAIIFCHRFFLCHSHATHDRRTMATVCMFLAGKVEETPRPLKDVILVSYEIIHKKDPAAVQRIKQKEVYEQQKEMILVGESLVLGTLAFDLNVNHPYKPLVGAIKKFKVAQNALAQVAWNFVNDGLRTSLCLQFKPHHIAAGAIFLAAKFLKVKLPSDGERVWWQEFDVTPRQLEEVSNQMLELYEQNRLLPAQGSEVEGSTGGVVASSNRAPSKALTPNEEQLIINTPLKPEPAKLTSYTDSCKGDLVIKSSVNKSDENIQENQERQGSLRSVSEEIERNAEKCYENTPGRVLELRDGIGQSPQEAIKRIDKDKLKAALEKRRKLRGDVTKKRDNLDEDDLIERELEDGIELAAESEKIKRGKMQNGEMNGKSSSRGLEVENVEEGEVSTLDDDVGYGSRSPNSINRKRKAEVSPSWL